MKRKNDVLYLLYGCINGVVVFIITVIDLVVSIILTKRRKGK